jgi:hypothetical protein
MIQCLKSRNTLRWVAPARGTSVATDPRRQFNPHDFAASQETIYILSKEGAGSAALLTTALTVAIAEAMEERAERVSILKKLLTSEVSRALTTILR